ncbi:MAG TPA: 6,7-dimethyl-8-ribityllumazine synthase [Thermoanaerobaculia bacterium]|nr:6,7-dimethyl-8-ribityllumazine synthase [Thermoanaerobaculia bacterium]
MVGRAGTVDGLDGAGKRVAIVSARFHGEIVERLYEGALEILVRHGVASRDLERVQVPGAWELPLALQWLAERGSYDLMVALGVVIRGDTPHFDYVCGCCADGIQRVTLDHAVPIGFGVLTCDTREQALARAGGAAGNKGWEAAQAALEMALLREGLAPSRDGISRARSSSTPTPSRAP